MSSHRYRTSKSIEIDKPEKKKIREVWSIFHNLKERLLQSQNLQRSDREHSGMLKSGVRIISDSTSGLQTKIEILVRN